MVKQAVKVVVRTRPTPDFASNNINLDPSHDVSSAKRVKLNLLDNLSVDSKGCAWRACEQSNRKLEV